MIKYFLILFTAGSLLGQTSGTTLPTNCVTGAIFIKTNAVAGQNTYVALATGSPCPGWTLQGDLGGCTATAGQMSCPNGFASTSSSPTLATYTVGTAPATPATGKGAGYSDSATKGLSFKDDTGQITRTVKPTDCTSVGLVQKINPDGTVGCAAGGGGTGGQYITTVPTIPATPGTDGQYTMDGTYYYAYKSRWYRVAWDSTWSSGTSATPTFLPTAGTYGAAQTVTISTASTSCGPYIYWKIGGTPTSADNHGTSASVTTTSTLHAKVIGCPTYTDSADGTAAYTIAGYIGPGDVVSGAVAWYGLRAYSSAKAGTRAASICNAGLVACADINSLANGNLDMAPVTGAPLNCGGTGGQCIISVLYDQTGNGHNATTLGRITGLDPNLRLNCSGTLPCAEWVASGNYVIPLTQAQPFTLDAVLERTANFSGYQFVGGTGGGAVTFGFNNAPNQAVAYAGGAAVLQGAMTDSAFHSLQVSYNGASSSLYVDGISMDTEAAGTNNLTQLCLGGCDAAFTGYLTEYGLWPGSIAASALAANQKAYWGF